MLEIGVHIVVFHSKNYVIIMNAKVVLKNHLRRIQNRCFGVKTILIIVEIILSQDKFLNVQID